MKNISFIITCTFLILINPISSAQNYGFISAKKENYSIELNFHTDSTYTLISTHHLPKSTVSMITILSMGTFSYAKEKYMLSEKINNYKIALSLANDTLRVKNGFGWMKDGYFVLESIVPDNSFVDFANSMPKKEDISVLSKELDRKQEKNSPLIYGTYSSDEFFKIRIDNNRTYSIYRYNFIFSKGNWERKENILLLYDKNVNGPFSLFIKNDSSLISIVIPADYMMRKFTLED